MITVRGRVRPTVRLKRDGDGAPCVLATSWASDRAFPRTRGAGVAFEIETDSGEVLRVDPFEALAVVPVRRRERREWREQTEDGAAACEDGWIAVGDEVIVDGERDGSVVRAARISGSDGGGGGGEETHRVPPRALATGEEEREAAVELPSAAVAAVEVAVEPAAEPPVEPAVEPAVEVAAESIMPASVEPPRARGRKHRRGGAPEPPPPPASPASPASPAPPAPPGDDEKS